MIAHNPTGQGPTPVAAPDTVRLNPAGPPAAAGVPVLSPAEAWAALWAAVADQLYAASLALPRPPRWLLAGLGALFVVVGLGLGMQAEARPPAAAPAATPALDVHRVAGLPTPVSCSALPVALAAYDAPGGRGLGALDSGRCYVVTGQAEGGWVQLDAGSGPVWVLRADFGQAPIVMAGNVPDLTLPTPVPPAATLAPVFAAPAPRPATADAVCMPEHPNLCHASHPAELAPAPAELAGASAPAELNPPPATADAVCMPEHPNLCHASHPARPRPARVEVVEAPAGPPAGQHNPQP